MKIEKEGKILLEYREMRSICIQKKEEKMKERS